MGGNDSGYPMMCRNWMAWPHQKLYKDIHAGPGIAGTQSTQDTYARIGALFARVDADLQAGLRQLGLAYEGSGSAAAQSGITVLQQWTADAQAGSTEASRIVADQASGYASARDRMPEPVPVTAQDGVVDKVYDFFGGTTPREAQEEQARAAHLQAARVMSEYDMASGSAASSMPTFVPPPPVTVQVAPPQSQQGPVQPGTGQWPAATGSGTTPGGSGGWGEPPATTPAAVLIPGPGVPPGGSPVPDHPGPPPGYPGVPNLPNGGSGSPPPGSPRPAAPGGQRPGDHERGRRPGTAGGYGSGGLGLQGPAARGRAGFGPAGDPDGFGPRGGGVNAGGRLPGFGGPVEDGVHGRGAGAAAVRGGGAGMAGFMQPAAPGSGGDEDREHQRKYVVQTDAYFADDRLVPPPVIGEHPQR